MVTLAWASPNIMKLHDSALQHCVSNVINVMCSLYSHTHVVHEAYYMYHVTLVFGVYTVQYVVAVTTGTVHSAIESVWVKETGTHKGRSYMKQ